MEFLTGLNIVITLMNVGMITYIHTTHLFKQGHMNTRTIVEDVDDEECDVSDDSKDSTYFSWFVYLISTEWIIY